MTLPAFAAERRINYLYLYEPVMLSMCPVCIEALGGARRILRNCSVTSLRKRRLISDSTNSLSLVASGNSEDGEILQ